MTRQAATPDPTHPLAVATRHLQVAVAAEAAAKRRAEKAKAAHSQAHEATLAQRKALAEVIVAAARGGAGNAEIRRITGYTRQRIQQICRRGGVEAPSD